MLLENGYVFATFNGINRFYLREDLREKVSLFQIPVNVVDSYRRREMVDLENQIYDLKNQVDQVHSAWEADVGRYENLVQDQKNRFAEQVLQLQEKLDRRNKNWQEEANWQLNALTRQNHERQEADQQLQALAQRNRELQGDLTQIREAFGEQLERINARFHLVACREQELRDMLLDAHEQLLRRDEEIQAALSQKVYTPAGEANAAITNGPFITGSIAAQREVIDDSKATPPRPEATTPPSDSESEYEPYARLVRDVRELVRREVPADASIVVISEGDNELLDMDGRKTWHFPCRDDESHADDYPEDGVDAIAQLQSLKAKGAEYLLIPSPALWVLDRYAELQEHLKLNHAVVAREECCTIYALHTAGTNGRRRTVHRGPRDDGQRPFGVNISGNIGSEKGTGEAVRTTIRSVAAADVPYVLNNVVDDFSDNPDQTYTQFTDENPYAVNIIQANADMIPPFVEKQGAEYLRCRYNIGYWFWELADFPQTEWQNSFQHLDEVWVGSNFVLDAVSRVAPVPVVKIPVSIAERLPVRPCTRAAFDLPADRFIFLFIVDFMSIPERKNPHGLIKAFKKAFRPDDKAMLVIKGAHSSPEWLKAVGAPPNVLEAIQLASEDANIRIIDRVMARDEVNALIALSDSYVSLHRSEGFGLPLAEAMSLERPVIGTGYSGNMDFMTPSNSYVVKYDLIELQQDYGPYRKGSAWADPDTDHAAMLMRHVFEHQDESRAVGLRGRQDILQMLHPEVTGAHVRQRLVRIAESGRVPAPPTPGPSGIQTELAGQR